MAPLRRQSSGRTGYSSVAARARNGLAGLAVVLLFVVGFLAAFGTAKGDSVAPVLGFVFAGMVVLLGPAMIASTFGTIWPTCR